MKKSMAFAMVFIALYLGSAFLTNSFPGAVELSAPLHLALALLPNVFFALFILAEVQLMRSLDELKQRIQLEALAIAFPATVLVYMSVDDLQEAGFMLDYDMGDVLVPAFLLYCLGLFTAWWRYR